MVSVFVVKALSIVADKLNVKYLAKVVLVPNAILFFNPVCNLSHIASVNSSPSSVLTKLERFNPVFTVMFSSNPDLTPVLDLNK